MFTTMITSNVVRNAFVISANVSDTYSEVVAESCTDMCGSRRHYRC
jgi:hypothetical protein